MGGTDVIHGGAGNDVISDSHSLLPLEVPNIILGGDGKDFIATWDDVSTIFGGQGDDFIYGSKPNLPGDRQRGRRLDRTGHAGRRARRQLQPVPGRRRAGNDIFVGGGGFDEMIGEGGDDIFVGSDAQDKMDGMSGFDWVTYKNDTIGVTVDLELAALNEPPIAASPASILDRFAEVEGLSGSKFADYLRGSEADANVIATFNAKTSALRAAGIARIAGLQALLDHALECRRPAPTSPSSAPATSSWAATAATSSSAAAATTSSTATTGSTCASACARTSTAPAPRSPASTAWRR